MQLFIQSVVWSNDVKLVTLKSGNELKSELTRCFEVLERDFRINQTFFRALCVPLSTITCERGIEFSVKVPVAFKNQNPLGVQLDISQLSVSKTIAFQPFNKIHLRPLNTDPRVRKSVHRSRATFGTTFSHTDLTLVCETDLTKTSPTDP